MVSDHHEGTFERLRYSFGGDRPSQTAHLTLSSPQIHGMAVRISISKGWYPNVDSTKANALASKSPTYPVHLKLKLNIKLQ